MRALRACACNKDDLSYRSHFHLYSNHKRTYAPINSDFALISHRLISFSFSSISTFVRQRKSPSVLGTLSPHLLVPQSLLLR